MNHFIMNLKSLNHFITCTRSKYHPETDQGGHVARTVDSLTEHQVSLLPHSNSKEKLLLLSLQMERQNLPIQDPAFLSVHSPKIFRGIVKPILLHCWMWDITLSLYLDVTLILADSHPKERKDRQRVTVLLQKLVFIHNLKKGKFRPT